MFALSSPRSSLSNNSRLCHLYVFWEAKSAAVRPQELDSTEMDTASKQENKPSEADKAVLHGLKEQLRTIKNHSERLTQSDVAAAHLPVEVAVKEIDVTTPRCWDKAAEVSILEPLRYILKA